MLAESEHCSQLIKKTSLNISKGSYNISGITALLSFREMGVGQEGEGEGKGRGGKRKGRDLHAGDGIPEPSTRSWKLSSSRIQLP